MDQLQIKNLVLSKLGEEEQLDDPDARTRANLAMTANWEGVRDQVLRMHLWNFAIDPGGKELTRDGAYTASVNSDFAYRYQMPDDFLRLDKQRCRPRSIRLDMKLGAASDSARRMLYTNTLGPILIVYVRREARWGLWDDLFCEAFACHMALQIGKRVVGEDFDRAAMARERQVALAQARAIDGRENPPDDIEETEWTSARYNAAPGTGVLWT